MQSRVITVFRSRLGDRDRDHYDEVAIEMAEVAAAMPGFIEVKTFTAEDGERVTLVTFADRASHDAWSRDPRHRRAQQLGRSTFYDEYTISVCDLVEERSFRRAAPDA